MWLYFIPAAAAHAAPNMSVCTAGILAFPSPSRQCTSSKRHGRTLSRSGPSCPPSRGCISCLPLQSSPLCLHLPARTSAYLSAAYASTSATPRALQKAQQRRKGAHCWRYRRLDPATPLRRRPPWLTYRVGGYHRPLLLLLLPSTKQPYCVREDKPAPPSAAPATHRAPRNLRGYLPRTPAA